MKITLEIDEREINAIAGEKGEEFVINEFKKDPAWFISNATDISADISQYYLARGILYRVKHA